MAEHQHFDARNLRAVGGLRRAGVIIEDVAHDLRGLLAPCLVEFGGELPDHLGLERLVNQQVGALRRDLERF